MGTHRQIAAGMFVRGQLHTDGLKVEEIQPLKWRCVVCHKQSTRRRVIGDRAIVICRNCEEAQKMR